MSLPEVLLWRSLRERPEGLKFRRQHPAGLYVLDFFCAEARLAIEVDGSAHGTGDRPTLDAKRDDWLAANGVATLRISARDVLAELDAVLTHIVGECRTRLPLHHPADGPPPRSGEE